MGELERGISTFLVIWAVLVLLGYHASGTGPATRASSESHW